MKKLFVLSFFVANISFAQESPFSFSKQLQPSSNFMSSFTTFYTSQRARPIDLNLQLPSNSDEVISDVKMIVRHQLNQVACSITNYTGSSLPIMGTSVTRTLQVGNTKLISDYVFDLQGNMVDYQFSIPIGKGN